MSNKQGNWITLKCAKNFHTYKKNNAKTKWVHLIRILLTDELTLEINMEIWVTSSYLFSFSLKWDFNEMRYDCHEKYEILEKLFPFLRAWFLVFHKSQSTWTYSIFGYVLNSTRSIAINFASYAYINRQQAVQRHLKLLAQFSRAHFTSCLNGGSI